MTAAVPILVLDNSFTFGGAINSLDHLFRALDRERFTPVLVTGQPPAWLESRFASCVCYHHIPKLSWVDNHRYQRLAVLPIFRSRWPRRVLNLARFCWWQIGVTLPETFRYYRLGRRHGVALIHLNNILGSQSAGILAAKLLRVPCVAHLRDFEEIHPLTRFYARLIDHHIAISRAIRDNLVQLGVPEDRISIVHDAVDLEEFDDAIDCSDLQREFDLNPDQPRFGIFGRVVDWKGIREFVHAVRLVTEEIPEARAFVVGGASDGDAAYFSEMQRLAVELGLDEKIVFTGYRQDVGALMKLMDVVVHASNRPEPFGMVIIEAMAMGKPVVATRAGGPLDIVADGDTGFLVPMGDAEALAGAVKGLLQQPERMRSMGARGRRSVEKLFANQRYADRVESIYRQALERRDHGQTAQ